MKKKLSEIHAQKNCSQLMVANTWVEATTVGSKTKLRPCVFVRDKHGSAA